MATTVPRLRTYRIVLEWDDGGPDNQGWMVTVPALPGADGPPRPDTISSR